MAFNVVPIEINEHIASYLTNDKDLCRFTLICHQTYAAVHTLRAGLWRQRFASCYDLPPGKLGNELKHTYQFRRKTLGREVHFVAGQEHAELWALEVIRDLMIESFAGPSDQIIDEPSSKNLVQLCRYIKRSDLLKNVLKMNCKGTVNPVLQTVQLLFMHWSLEFHLDFPTFSFPCSQQAVYGHPAKYPMYLDDHMFRVNISLLLHIANFFKYHMTREEEATLYHLFNDLEEHEKPRAWQGKLTQGVKKLGRLWKGSYSYLHDLGEVPSIRTSEPGAEIFTDSIDYEDGFQTLDIDFTPANCPPWPEAFDRHLHSMPSERLVNMLNDPNKVSSKRAIKNVQGPAHYHRRTSTPTTNHLPPTPPATPNTPPSSSSSSSSTNPSYAKKGRDYLPFTGTGHDAEPFHCSGILHPLPPQQEIPGWQRITLMKYFDADYSSSQASSSPSSPTQPSTPNFYSTINHETWIGEDGEEDEYNGIDIGSGCWAYEGVVLPGGMIMLGRWWSPMDEGGEQACTGPFIFWNVEDRTSWVEGPDLSEVS